MSMRAHPQSGYLVPVEDILKVLDTVLPGQDRTALYAAISGAEFEDACEYLSDMLPSEYPKPICILVFAPEDDVPEDARLGVAYALFDDEDLYEKTLRPGASALYDNLKMQPELQSFAIWG